jgi:hypothetical protein
MFEESIWGGRGIEFYLCKLPFLVMLPTNDGRSSGWTLYLILELEPPLFSSGSGDNFSIGCVAFLMIPEVPSLLIMLCFP